MSSQSTKQMIQRKIDSLYELYYELNETLIVETNVVKQSHINERMHTIRTQITIYKRDIETITNNDRMARIEQRLFTSTIK